MEKYQESERVSRYLRGAGVVLKHLTDRHTQVPFPAMSDHYINHNEVVPEANQHHCTATNVNNTPGGRWGSMGEY